MMGQWSEMMQDIEASRIAREHGGRWINDVDSDGIPWEITEQQIRDFVKPKRRRNRRKKKAK